MESILIENQKKLYGIDVEKGNLQNQQAIIQERRGELNRHLEYCQNRQRQLGEKKQELETAVVEKKNCNR